VFAGRPYEVERAVDDGEIVLTLRGAEGTVLTLRVRREAPESEPVDLRWVSEAAAQPPASAADVPAVPALEELSRGIETTGLYATSTDVATPPWTVRSWQASVLALASYVVGMKVPGLRSLFTRATVRFHNAPPGGRPLAYRVATTRFDRHFRLLDADLCVATPEGSLVATARLRSYVPFSPVVVDPAELEARLVPGTERLRGQVALVCGASRGLGADIAAALAAAGYQVYAASRGDRPTRESRSARGGRIESMRGDVGDPAWCEAAVETIRAAHGRLDLLVLNACAPPEVLRLGPDATRRQDEYVHENLRLVQTPLVASLSLLDSSQGRVVYLSSSYVSEPVVGFSAYIALKQAGEGLVRTAALERPRVRTVIVRPPTLRTRWNDTPTGAAGAIPSDWVASHLVNQLAAAAAPPVETLTNFPPFEPQPSHAEEEPSRAPADFSVRVAATFTADPLVPASGSG
jgi:NAD(P)-dependent dehydrogenase (short-subunit alcohol dehydrogenase family)